jgi:preprotein translocase subunit SecG
LAASWLYWALPQSVLIQRHTQGGGVALGSGLVGLGFIGAAGRDAMLEILPPLP